MSSLSGHLHRFSDFTIDIEQKVLLRGGKAIPMAPKVFETLLALVENHGRIVLKEELMKRLWPDTFVEESNLTFNIQQLRKSLGDNAREPLYIETIPRRGYRFIAEVKPLATSIAPAQPAHIDTNEPVPPATVLTKARVITILAVVGVAVAGLVYWSSARSGGRSSNEINAKDAPGSRLKLVELTATGQSHHVAISPDGKYVAYTRLSQNSTEIWVRQLASNTNVELLTADRIAGLGFDKSGESLLFVKGDPSALYRVSLIGGVPTKLIDGLEGKFAVSPDGSQIAFIREVVNRDGQREFSLHVANADGRNERTLLVRAHPGKLDVPIWSSDGQSIICAHGNSAAGSQDVSLIAVNVNTGEKKDLSSFKFFIIKKMDWLPDRSGLIISARKNAGFDNQLFRVTYPAMEVTQITDGLTSYSDISVAANADVAAASQSVLESYIWIGRDPRNLKKITQAINNFCWTPDGRIVYSTTASGTTDIWIMQPDGKEQKQLTVNAGINGSPAISSSGQRVVFVSNRTGTFQIWRMNLDGSNQTQLTSGSAKNYPAISADGKWVLFNSTEDWHLWRVPIDGGEATQLTDFVAGMPSVSPDGKTIACIGRNESKRELLILPFEGGQPVKKLGFFGWMSRIQWTNDGKTVIYAGDRNGRSALIRQSLNGDLIEDRLNLDTDELFDFGYSVDGRSLAITRGGWLSDIVLISGLRQ